jgi:hypothetical protein
VAKTQIFFCEQIILFAEPHPHEVRNSWPKASRVFENQKNVHACTLGALRRILDVRYQANIE